MDAVAVIFFWLVCVREAFGSSYVNPTQLRVFSVHILAPHRTETL
jgi:hypothetical protein